MSSQAFTRGRNLCFTAFALFILALLPDQLAAQRGGSDRGSSGRGGSGGGFQGRGGSGGGFQGRGGSTQGRGGSDRGSQGRGGSTQGRGGSDRGSQGRGGSTGGGASEFLKRMDANGNGSLDPSEQGRLRPMLERISSARRDRGASSLDLSRPIPMSQLSEEFNRMREQGGSSRGSQGRGGSNLSRGDSGSLSRTELEPLVPNFAFEQEQFIPLPTFGPEGERNTVNITEADRKEAAQTMKRYDKNGDNVLSKEEIAQARWRDDPLQQDRNRDGKLSLNELYLRYALRRNDTREQPSSSNRSSSSRGSSSRTSSSRDSGSRDSGGRGSSGRGSSSQGGNSSGSSAGTDRMAFFANSMMQRYDKNGSGVLEKSEWAGFRTDPSPGDTNKDGKLTKDELTKWMSSRFGQSRGGGDSGRGSSGRGSSDRGSSDRGSSGRGSSGRGGSDRGGNERGSSGRGGSQGGRRGGDSNADTAESYRFKTLGERLPEGLPEWFKSNDGNGDGQIMMSEYAKNWNAQMLDSFDKFDFNADGVITPEECLDGIDEGATYGGAGGSSRGRSSSNDKKDDGKDDTQGKSSSSKSTGTLSRTAKYVNGVMEKYDTDKNGSLDKAEWSKNRWVKDSYDKNEDGKMTVEELTKGFGG